MRDVKYRSVGSVAKAAEEINNSIINYEHDKNTNIQYKFKRIQRNKQPKYRLYKQKGSLVKAAAHISS